MMQRFWKWWDEPGHGYRRLLTGIIGLFVTGGLWKYAAEPLLDLAVRMASKLPAWLVDSMYADAAKDPRYQASVRTYLFGVSAIIVAYTLAVLRLGRHARSLTARTKAVEKKALGETPKADTGARSNTGETAIRAEIDGIKEALLDTKRRLVIGMIVTPMFVVWLLWSYVAISLSVDVFASFDRTMRIAAPSLSDDEEEVYQARFASMRTKAEYDVLVADLKKTATDRGVHF